MKFLRRYNIQEGIKSSDWKEDIINQIIDNKKYYPVSPNDIEDIFLYHIEGSGDKAFIERSVCDREGNIPSKKLDTLNRIMYPCYSVRFVHKLRCKHNDAQRFVSDMSNELKIISQIDRDIDEKLSDMIIKDKRFQFYGSSEVDFNFIVVMKEPVNEFIHIISKDKSKLPPVDNLRGRIIDLNIFNIISFSYKDGVVNIRVEIKREYSNIKTRPNIILQNTLSKHFPGIRIIPVEEGKYRIIDIIYVT